MFTGIIQHLVKIVQLEKSAVADNFTLIVNGKFLSTKFYSHAALGGSYALNGICLTLAEKITGAWVFHLSPETYRITAASTWKVGQYLNFEPALKFGDELGGHLLSGHIDGTGIIKSFMKTEKAEAKKFLVKDAAKELILTLSTELIANMSVKGSVAVDGCSLTINQIINNDIHITLIPHTMMHTCFQFLEKNDKVNIEIDFFMRYVRRVLETSQKTIQH